MCSQFVKWCTEVDPCSCSVLQPPKVQVTGIHFVVLQSLTFILSRCPHTLTAPCTEEVSIIPMRLADLWLQRKLKFFVAFVSRSVLDDWAKCWGNEDMFTATYSKAGTYPGNISWFMICVLPGLWMSCWGRMRPGEDEGLISWNWCGLYSNV